MKFKVTINVAHYFYFGHLTFNSIIPPKTIFNWVQTNLKYLIYVKNIHGSNYYYFFL